MRRVERVTLNVLKSRCDTRNPIQFLVSMAGQLTSWENAQEAIATARKELDERKRCRCTRCGEWTEIRTVHNREVKRIKNSRTSAPEQI